MLIDPEFECSVCGGIDKTNTMFQSSDEFEDRIFSTPVEHVFPVDKTIVGRPWRRTKDTLCIVFDESGRMPPVSDDNWSEINIPIGTRRTVDDDGAGETI